MADSVQVAAEAAADVTKQAAPEDDTFEPPKYLKDLIAAINDGAKSAQLGALAFTAIGVFHAGRRTCGGFVKTWQ